MSKNKIFYFLTFFCCILFFSIKLIGQSQIIGVVRDTKKRPISNVTIKILACPKKRIIAYTFSNTMGEFAILSSHKASDSVELEFSCIGYKLKSITLLGISKEKLEIELETNDNKLPEVKVKNSPLYEKNDTLTYTIKPFTQQTDAVIGDVLKRIPGIEITESGVIKYQGKAINKYYIEGLNLLDDKYTLANRNIPATTVEKVQILENHQPLKILDSISFSTQAALNLILTDKSKDKIIGRLKTGLGATPLLLDQEVVPMKFNKQTQYIASYKYNNAGINYSDELSLLNSADLANNIASNSTENLLLSIPAAIIPQTNSQRFLFNDNHTLSLNRINKIKNELTIKSNFDFLIDKQKQNNGTTNTLYFQNDTIQVVENQILNFEKLVSRLFITLEKNTKNIYFLNSTKIQYQKNYHAGILNSIINTNQLFKNNHLSFSNNGSFVTKQNKLLLYGNYQISYSKMPQSLSILPGIYDSILNSSKAYDELLQKVVLSTFYTNAEVGFSRKFKNLTIQNNISLNYINQNFESQLLKSVLGDYNLIAKNFENSLKINQYTLTNSLTLSYKINNVKINLSVPISYINQQLSYTSRDTVNKQIFKNHNLSIHVPFGGRFGLFFTNSNYILYLSPYTTTNGTILSNYRSLQNNSGIISNINQISNSILITYKDALKIIFASLGVTQEETKQPLIYNQSFIGNLSIMEATPFNNANKSFSYGARISKYFLPIKSSITLGINFKQSENFQMNRNQLSTSYVKTIGINNKISSKIGPILIDHTIQYQKILNGLNKTLTPSYLMNQTLTNTILLSDLNYFKINLEQSYFNRPGITRRNFYFLDLSFKQKLINKKIDIEASWLNILNTTNFETLNYSSNTRTLSFYILRPSQVMIKVAFNF